jgi:putative DNA modification/repair radical SAM protein
MDIQEKLSLLAGAAKYDASCASSGSNRPSKGGLGATLPSGVCHSWTGDGRCVSLLKILYSNVCRLDCAYCVNRASNDIRRTSFTTDEIVSLTLSFYRRNYIEGLFLSSGIFSDPDIVMARLTDTARRLRMDHGFQGYIHLKTIPGSGERALREAARWADRLSANIELPTESSLRTLAPQKSGAEIIDSMRFLKNSAAERLKPSPFFTSAKLPFMPAGQSTQLIIGASQDSDATILRLANSLYGKMNLKRVYYSAYMPVSPDARLPRESAPLAREHRLYQADWLLRFYKFSIDDILESQESKLDLDIDPKTAWALRHPEFFPVELCKAEFEKILRVPGIGIIGAQRILSARRASHLSWESLPKLGVSLKRAAYFITVNGKSRGAAGFSACRSDPLALRGLLSNEPRRKSDQPLKRKSERVQENNRGQMEFAF